MDDPRIETDDWEGEPTKEEHLSAPTAAVLAQLRKMAETIERQGEAFERQGEAVDRLSIAVAQQTDALKKLTAHLTDPLKGRDR